MFDVAIIGAGPAGLTAGIYSGRARLETLIFESNSPGGQIILTLNIENFPGFPGGIKTFELVERLTKQVADLGINIENTEIKNISKGDNFKLLDSQGKECLTRSIIIATGAQPKRLAIPGEDQLTSRGVSYCAVCDGVLFKEKDIIVIGGGNKAVEEALFLSRFAKTIKLIHRRDKLRATQILQEHLIQNKKIEVIWDSIPIKILGNDRVSGLKIKNVKTQKEAILNCQGVFIAIGVIPNTQLLDGFVKMDENGYILTDENMMTTQKGIFACGDCRRNPLQQVITACAEGAIAAVAASKYLQEL